LILFASQPAATYAFASPSVYVNNFNDLIRNTDNFGGAASHELGHRLLGVGELDYDSHNPNIMMFGSVPNRDQSKTLAWLNPNSPLWKFTPSQISQLFQKCLKSR
jgi:hypothetical protein